MAIYKLQQEKKPPKSQIGAIRWLRENLFSNLTNTALTLLTAYALYLVLPPILNWIIFDANFANVTNAECGREGACWAFIYANIDKFAFGLYPSEEHFRPLLVLLLTIGLFVSTKFLKNYKHKFRAIFIMFLLYPVVAFILFYGGIFGLEVVETDKWGGLMLTIIIASVGIIASFPIGIFLALGRQSKMPIIRNLSVFYIEFIRGVPLITILFMASVILPMFLSEGVSIDKLLRALVGITMFQAAYIAEVIRGGLQAVPKGQYEAADAMGLNFLNKTALIIMPQALKISIPNIVGSFISLFKDTTLVLIIGLFDVLAIVNLASSNTNWLGRHTEGYVFVAMVLWIILYTMSRYAKSLEIKFSTENNT